MKVQFPYNPILIDEIKSIPGRTWDPADKSWSFPDEYLGLAIQTIAPHYPEIAASLNEYALKEEFTSPTLLDISNAASVSDLTTIEANNLVEQVKERLQLPHKLYPYQELCVAFLEAVEAKGTLVADAMGLGKTVETLAWLSLYPERRPVLVVAPASVKRNWYREIQKWLPDETIQLISSSKDEFETDKNFYIINYDLIWRMEEKIYDLSISTTIFDEVTAIKEAKAKRSKVARQIGRNSNYVLGLSGTPILNRPIEFFNFLNLIKPEQFSNYFKFGLRYGNPKSIVIKGGRKVWSFPGATNLQELRNLLKPIMIRRSKQQVLTELPDKRREMLYLDLPSKFTKEYRTAERNLIQQLRDFKQDPNLQKADLLATLAALRHLVGLAKVENACEFIKSFADSNDKLVVFGHHHDVLDGIEAILKQENIKFVSADGKTKNEDRQKRIDIFQNDPEYTIFLATTAMGMGITLTAASNSLFVERQWSPAMEEQMEDRLHRIGQKRGVIAWYLQVENTVDERMAKIVSEKRSVLEQILDANEEEILERSVVNEILETYSD